MTLKEDHAFLHLGSKYSVVYQSENGIHFKVKEYRKDDKPCEKKEYAQAAAEEKMMQGSREVKSSTVAVKK